MARPLAAGRLDGLQVLRGFAAAYVVLFHLVPATGIGRDVPVLAAVAQWGFAGVDLFFVLSGFVVAHTTGGQQGRVTAWRFLGKRFARIFLGYWPLLAATAALYLWLAPGVLAEVNLIGSVFLAEPRDTRLLITVAWSLVYELYFYGLFAALLLVSPGVRLAGIGIGLVLVAAANGVLIKWYPQALDGSAVEGGFFLSPFVAEFLGGSLLAAYCRTGFVGLGWRGAAAGGIVLATLGMAAALAGGSLPVHQVERLAGPAPTAAGLILAVVALEGRVAWPRWTVALGDRSYALYLTHPVVLSIGVLAGVLSGPLPSLPVGLLRAAAVLAIAMMVAHGYYLWIEQPLYRWACRWLDR